MTMRKSLQKQCKLFICKSNQKINRKKIMIDFSITYTHYNELKSQPHLMPHSVSVCGFIGHAFINKLNFA